MKFGEVVVTHLCYNFQFHQVSSKSDKKQKSFINSPFFCSKFQSVSRIVKIVHSATSTSLTFDAFFYFYFTLRCFFMTYFYKLSLFQAPPAYAGSSTSSSTSPTTTTSTCSRTLACWATFARRESRNALLNTSYCSLLIVFSNLKN